MVQSSKNGTYFRTSTLPRRPPPKGAESMTLARFVISAARSYFSSASTVAGPKRTRALPAILSA